MKLIIDIPEEDYKNGTLINYFKCYSTELDKIIYSGTPLETHQNRCDSCTHSEEQDGSNCYECVKGMADNFEAQSTDAVSREEAIFIVDEYAIGGETWAQRKDCVELLKQLPSVQPQPCEDAVSRSEAITELTALIENFKGIQGDMGSAINSARELIKTLSIVMPQRKKGKWIEVNRGIHVTDYRCSECGRIVRDDTGYDVSADYPYCHCGAEMSGGEEDEVSD